VATVEAKGASGARLVVLMLAVGIGVADALIFLGFEWLIKNGTDWLWNDVAGSDEERWRVIPLALVLSVAFSALLRALRQPRWTPPHLDPLKSADHDEEPAAPTLVAVGTILLIGAVSLLSGASLGPEAALVATAIGLGTWAAARAGLGERGRVLALASAGALLVSFFGSLVTLAIPLLLLYQRTKRLPLPAVVVIALSGLAAWGTLHLVEGEADVYAQIPDADVNLRDYAAALLLGAVAAGVGAVLHWLVIRLASVTERIQTRVSWWLAAAVFGTILGLLYLAGGPTVEFSGTEGSAELLSGERRYGAAALAGLVLVKLLATSWSLTAGYRGGLVFPSLYAGVAVSLFVAAEFPDVAGPGVLIAVVAGLLVAMTSPVAGIVMLLALLPLEQLPLGLAGAAGAIAGYAVVSRRRASAAPSSTAGTDSPRPEA
jgi:H+/Cl- antiporter ClcA